MINSYCDKTKIVTQLETQIVTKLKISNSDKTLKLKLRQNSKLKWYQNSNCEKKTKIVAKLKNSQNKNLISDKTKKL